MSWAGGLDHRFKTVRAEAEGSLFHDVLPDMAKGSIWKTP